jgi:hypothetical protein
MAQHANLSPVADIISLGAIAGTLMHFLPPIAAVLAIIWYCLEIYESETVKHYFARRHRRLRRAHRKRWRRVSATHMAQHAEHPLHDQAEGDKLKD